jgi:hypothetical protein
VIPKPIAFWPSDGRASEKSSRLGLWRYRDFAKAALCNRTIRLKQRKLPEVLCHLDRRDLHIIPPRNFVAMAMQILVMVTAERDGKFVADLASERSRLGKFEVVGVAGRALADNTGLGRNEGEVGFVPPDTVVNAEVFYQARGSFAHVR